MLVWELGGGGPGRPYPVNGLKIFRVQGSNGRRTSTRTQTLCSTPPFVVSCKTPSWTRPGSIISESISNSTCTSRAPAEADSRGLSHIVPLSANAYTHFREGVRSVTARVTASGHSHVTSNSVASGDTFGTDDNRSASKYCCTAPSDGASSPVSGYSQPSASNNLRTEPSASQCAA